MSGDAALISDSEEIDATYKRNVNDNLQDIRLNLFCHTSLTTCVAMGQRGQ